MMVKNFFILQLGVKMKKSKRYIKKQNNNIDLIKLDINYNIQWEECSCLKGIRLEDVTEELEDKAYEEMRHN